MLPSHEKLNIFNSWLFALESLVWITCFWLACISWTPDFLIENLVKLFLSRKSYFGYEVALLTCFARSCILHSYASMIIQRESTTCLLFLYETPTNLYIFIVCTTHERFLLSDSYKLEIRKNLSLSSSKHTLKFSLFINLTITSTKALSYKTVLLNFWRHLHHNP